MSEKNYWKVSDLRLWDKNPRSINKKDFERLKKQIQKLGQYKPLIITKDGEVIGGNMRLKAYKELGIDEVWVSVVTPKDESEKLEYALSDNDRAGYYDDDLIANLMPDYHDFSWGDYAVDLKEPQTLDDLIQSLQPVEEDEVPEVQEGEPDSKLGEVYQLGRHRLMCGDATKIEDVEKLMNGQKADVVFTDPPYGMDLDADYEAMSKKSTKVKGIKYSNVMGDDEDFDPRPFIALFPEAKEQLWWGADYYYERLPSGGSWMVWVKRNENMTDIIGNHFEVCWSMSKHKRRVIYKAWSGVTARNPEFAREHPTEKPISLNADLIRESSVDGDVVVDLFLGSGSTLIACEQTDRTCYGMELDPKYCDVIRKRYENFVQNNKKQ